MCGLIGSFDLGASSELKPNVIKSLCVYSQRRGSDSSGMYQQCKTGSTLTLSDRNITKLASSPGIDKGTISLIAHSRLQTNSNVAYQPFLYEDYVTAHNGIVLNYEELWESIAGSNYMEGFDSSIIPAYISHFHKTGLSLEDSCSRLLSSAKGTISAIVYSQALSKVCLLTNNSNLYYCIDSSQDGKRIYVASEESFLKSSINNADVRLVDRVKVFDTRCDLTGKVKIFDKRDRSKDSSLLTLLSEDAALENLLVDQRPTLKRCTKCILPSTMPYISFDSDGVCNYCLNYKSRIKDDDLGTLSKILGKYTSNGKGVNCIVPFSGGRDSTFALHLAVKSLGLKPITYTYDWGMITDLGRRNISLMCQELGIENILISADIRKKRKYIRSNLLAWLRRPHLGMISLLTAGDKHFFRHIEAVKRETDVDLNLWGINPLEITHFKSGFLGIKPGFEENTVYSNGLTRQLEYQAKRYYQYILNYSYINRSIPDNLSGEYWRSIHKKSDYYALFDYYPWHEEEVENVLDHYGWERAIDTKASWRIGDGTAAFYNYVYYLVAGFTEHDTFRSNQIREGQLDRAQALEHIHEENRPRYQNIKWYLDTVGVDFGYAIKKINNMSRMY